MKQKKIVLGILLALVLLLGVAYLLYAKLGSSIAPNQLSAQGAQDSAGGAPGVSSQQPQPVPAPDFTVYDGDGNAVHLSDYVGKPVVMNFWASWCGPCQNEMPDFEQAYADYGDEIEFVMLNATYGRETMDSARSFLEESGYTFPVYYDTDADAAAAIGVTAFPTTLFIAPDGTLTAYAISMLDAETLQRGIDMLLDSAA